MNHDRTVRTAVYQALVDTGLPPHPGGLAASLHLAAAEVSAGLGRLAENHELVLLPGTDRVWMAHPFSGVPTDYVVEHADGRRWWANCAWDALAIPTLLGDSSITVQSPLDGEPWQFEVRAGKITPSHLVHFLVPAAGFWDNIGFT